MRQIEYCVMQENFIESPLDLKIWNYLINSLKKKFYKDDLENLITITRLAKHFNVTEQKIETFIKRAKSSGFIKETPRSIYINPNVLLPIWSE